MSSLFPSVDPVPNDPLDFLFPDGPHTLGVEVTELCREDERREAARLGYVAPRAKQLYANMLGAKPVSVSPVFSHQAPDLQVEDLARGLADFVLAHRDANANLSWREYRDMPTGYSQIGVFPPFGFEPEGNWRYFRGFSTERAGKELVEARIAEKNGRLESYCKVASRVWLLIVNDRFLGPGEVWLRAEDLAQWTFDFDFEKVSIFQREAGGTGEISELRRR